MRLSPLLKALALIVFLAALAGATYGVNAVLGDTTKAQAVTVEALGSGVNATPGHNVTVPVKITNRGTASMDVAATVSGLGAEARSAVVTAPANQNHTVFVTFSVPADAAPGDHRLGLKVTDASGALLRERADAVALRVLAPGTGFASGDSADVYYTGRIAATGNVFSTNDPALAGQQFAKTTQFPGTVNTRTLQVTTVPRISVVQGFFEGMIGMQEGESRTFTFGPEKGYGNATNEQREARESVLPSNETLPLPSAQLTAEQFGQYLADTNQGRPEDFDVNDTVVNERDGTTLRYRITSKDAAGVSLVLDVKVGERYTLHEVWPNASVVTAVDAGNVSFRTTPPVGLNEKFTFFGHWPGMSEITRINETSIVVRHSPNVGLEYTLPSSNPLQEGARATVKELTDTEIVFTTPSSNPLAGRELTFDVRIVALRKAG